MKLARLLRMGPAEIVDRSRQHAAGWLDRAGRYGPRTWDVEGDARRAGMVREQFRESVAARFFAGATSEALVDVVDRRMPEVRERLLAEADAISRGRFDLLGYRELSFGDPLEWHLDPLSGRRAPLLHYTRLDPLDTAVAGDSKVVWELNRHQWFVRLGQAWQLTADGRYAKAFALAAASWLRANPRGLGINWTSSLELAFRLIAWSWALTLFRRCEELDGELFAAMVHALAEHAAHTERHLSHYFAPNTHLTGEALGLVYAGTVFPELAGADRWRQMGAEILLAQSERQQLPDGVYFEQSTSYQRYTIDIYLHYLILARRNGLAVPGVLGPRVQRLLDFLLALRRPDGAMPDIGDNDGGWLLPLVRREPDDHRAAFSTAAVLFDRGDYAWAAGGLAPETLWLLGPDAADAFAALEPRPPASAPSRLFPQGGWAVMRDGWQADGHQLLFDVGPLGCPVTSGHGHADLLGLQCTAFGQAYLVDAGTYGYTPDAWRDFFRGTGAHSTVLVDGIDQATPTGPFAWRSRPRARLRRWRSTEAYDLADAEHGAYRRLPDPVLHRRRVAFVKPRYWIVVDDLEGLREHRVELRFQFGPLPVAFGPGLSVRALGPDGRALLVRAFAEAPLSAELHRGTEGPIRGWVSHAYGQRQPAPVLVYTSTARLPLRILTLLWPIGGGGPRDPEAVVLRGDDGRPAGLAFEDGHRVIFHEDDLELRDGAR